MSKDEKIAELERAYDPDYDISTPLVSWTDGQLLALIKDLYLEIKVLREQTDHLEDVLQAHLEN